MLLNDDDLKTEIKTSLLFGVCGVGSFIKLSGFVIKGHGVKDFTYHDMDCDFHFMGVVATTIEDAEPFFPIMFSPCMKSDAVEVIFLFM